MTNTAPLRAECRARQDPHVTARHSPLTSHLRPSTHTVPPVASPHTRAHTALACPVPATLIRLERRQGRSKRKKERPLHSRHGNCASRPVFPEDTILGLACSSWLCVILRCHQPTPLRWPGHDAQHSDSHTVSERELDTPTIALPVLIYHVAPPPPYLLTHQPAYQTPTHTVIESSQRLKEPTASQP